MEDARALLNGLMGCDRNAELKQRRVRKFTDEDICKKFLLGLCPHELFKNTKMDIGPCNKTHNEHLKEVFEADSDVARYRRKWRSELRAQLRLLLRNVDRLMETNQGKLARESDGSAGATDEQNYKVTLLKEEVSEKLKQAELAADNGQFDESRRIVKETEALKQRIEDLESKRAEKPKKGTICEVCGLKVSAEEMEDIAKFGRGWHTDGRQHIGYTLIRQRMKEIEAEDIEDAKNGVRSTSRSPAKEHSRNNVGQMKDGRARSRSAPKRAEPLRRRAASTSRSPRRASVDDRRSWRDAYARSRSRRRLARSSGASRSPRPRKGQCPSPSLRRKRSSRSPGVRQVRASQRLNSPARARSPSASRKPSPRRSASRGAVRKKRRSPPRRSPPPRSQSPNPPLPEALPPTHRALHQVEEAVLPTGVPNVANGDDGPPATTEPVSEETKEPPSSTSKPVALPVRFVLGLGKLNVTSLKR